PLTLTLHHAITTPVTLTTTYRSIRAARPLQGELELMLPKDVAIDTSKNVTFQNPLPPANTDGTIDILFNPSGQAAFAGNPIRLWVRDVTTDPSAPDQTLIAVYGA